MRFTGRGYQDAVHYVSLVAVLFATPDSTRRHLFHAAGKFCEDQLTGTKVCKVCVKWNNKIS